jgi:hypothetical protein
LIDVIGHIVSYCIQSDQKLNAAPIYFQLSFRVGSMVAGGGGTGIRTVNDKLSRMHQEAVGGGNEFE